MSIFVPKVVCYPPPLLFKIYMSQLRLSNPVYFRAVYPVFLFQGGCCVMFEANNELVSSYEGLSELLKIYSQLDSMIADFKSRTGLDCIKRCRKCCGTPARNIEVSVLEVLPLSICLWQKGEADYWLRKTYENGNDKPCVLYEENPSVLSESGCRAYTWRPLICRLFGFSAVLDKQGSPVISLCKHLKETEEGLESRIQSMVNSGTNIPVNSHFAQRVSFINPALGQIRYPINEAIRLALENVGFRIALLSNSCDDEGTPPRGPKVQRTA